MQLQGQLMSMPTMLRQTNSQGIHTDLKERHSPERAHRSRFEGMQVHCYPLHFRPSLRWRFAEKDSDSDYDAFKQNYLGSTRAEYNSNKPWQNPALSQRPSVFDSYWVAILYGSLTFLHILPVRYQLPFVQDYLFKAISKSNYLRRQRQCIPPE